MKYKNEDTIVAPATAMVNQAISIIRISGSNSFNVANKIVRKKINHNERINLRKIYDGETLIDECIFLSFFNGKSFTGEEMIEINCHGGIKVVSRIISLLIKKGCRMAENGEFSKRAFMNGKINLIQSEGINRLINSSTEKDVIINSKIVSKKNSEKLSIFKDQLIDIISRIQTSIDYPDYDDIEEIDNESISLSLKSLYKKINNIISDNEVLLTIHSGIKVCLFGKPNVGKSSILNCLSREEKAIVSDVKGTTRDIVESIIEYKGFLFKFWDTAGIRKTRNKVEIIGIEKSRTKMQDADVVIHVVDNIFDAKKILNEINKKNEFILLNKIDLINEKIPNDKLILPFSILNDKYEIILDKIVNYFNIDSIISNNDTIYLSSWGDISIFKNIKESINKCLNELENGQYLDIIIVTIYDMLNSINQVLGIDNSNEVIDNIFKKYCLGK